MSTAMLVIGLLIRRTTGVLELNVWKVSLLPSRKGLQSKCLSNCLFVSVLRP
jgi:hypothetical protein